jgi:hypothetical protein
MQSASNSNFSTCVLLLYLSKKCRCTGLKVTNIGLSKQHTIYYEELAGIFSGLWIVSNMIQNWQEILDIIPGELVGKLHITLELFQKKKGCLVYWLSWFKLLWQHHLLALQVYSIHFILWTLFIKCGAMVQTCTFHHYCMVQCF